MDKEFDMRYLIFTMFLLASTAADACRIKIIAIEDRIKNADLIFVGLVTGIELPDHEKLNEKYNLGKPYDGHGGMDTIVMYENVSYRTLPYKPYKGKLGKPVQVQCDNGCGCMGGNVALREKALFIVRRTDSRLSAYVIPATDSRFDSTIQGLKAKRDQRNNKTTQ
ncbi:MAG: hypothetical protein ACREPB_01600 [Arenimonas sp.]